MDKLVITTDNTNPDSYLIQCLNLLFSDCVIEIVDRKSGVKDTFPLESIDNTKERSPQHTELLANS
jgi:hypothetical protein